MSKSFSAFALIILFFLGLFAFNTQESFFSNEHLMVNAAYDPMTVIANITLSKPPRCVAANEETNRVYVGAEGGLLVINGETDQVITEILSGDDVVALAVNPLTNRIYAGIYGGDVAVIDGATNLKVGEIPARSLYDSINLAVNPVTNRVYVAQRAIYVGEDSIIRVFDGETNQFLTSVALGQTPYFEEVGVGVNPDTNKVYATWTGNNSVFMIDGNTNLITNNVAPSYFDVFGQDVMINPYTNRVYIGTAILNGETLEEITPSLNGVMKAVDYVHNFLYTLTSFTNFSRLDGSTHDLIDSLQLHWTFSSTYDRAAVNPATSKIYINNHGGNQTSVVAPLADTVSPTGSVTINNGDSYTISTSVVLSLTYSDVGSGVSQVRFGNDGLWDTESWETPVASRAWSLTSGDGTKTVYYQVQDNTGLLSPTYFDSIVLDTTASWGSVQINSGADYTNVTTVSLSLVATDSGSGVSQMRFSNDGATFTDWESYATAKIWDLSTGDGVKYVHVQFKDYAGLTASAYDDITLDMTLPMVNAGQNQNVQIGQTVTFNGSACADDNGIASYSWTFGDGATATGMTTTHTYSNSGTYNVTLTVEDFASNKNTSGITVNVQEVIPEFPSTLLLTATMTLLTALTLAFRKKKILSLDQQNTTTN